MAGAGKVIVNDRELENYFRVDTARMMVFQPLELTGTMGQYLTLLRPWREAESKARQAPFATASPAPSSPSRPNSGGRSKKPD
jgi:ribosomal protein S9